MLDRQIPPWRHAKPCSNGTNYNSTDRRIRIMHITNRRRYNGLWGLPIRLKGIQSRTCCIICGNSEQRVLRPWSSKIFSRVMSWRATKVVSSMSIPAWFANVKTGKACIDQWAFRSRPSIRKKVPLTCLRSSEWVYTFWRTNSWPEWHGRVISTRKWPGNLRNINFFLQGIYSLRTHRHTTSPWIQVSLCNAHVRMALPRATYSGGSNLQPHWLSHETDAHLIHLS